LVNGHAILDSKASFRQGWKACCPCRLILQLAVSKYSRITTSIFQFVESPVEELLMASDAQGDEILIRIIAKAYRVALLTARFSRAAIRDQNIKLEPGDTVVGM
jgi:hypothetical protein